MYGSASNRPLITFRWIFYAALLALFIVAPYLAAAGSGAGPKHPPSLLRGVWAAGAYAIYLILHTVTPLSETSRRLTFQRLGLVLGETALAIMAVALFGSLDPSARVFCLAASLLISVEHGPKLGMVSAVLSSLFGLWHGGINAHTLVFSMAALTIPGIPLALQQADAIRRELRTETDADHLDKAYQIARRETTKRQEHEQELYQERRRFEGLVDIAMGLVQMHDQESLLQRIVEVASDQLNARSALVLLLQDGRLRARAEVGMSTLMVEAIEQAVDVKLLQTLAQRGAPLIFGTAEASVGLLPQEDLLKGFARLISLEGRRISPEMRVDQMLAVPLSSAQDRAPFGLLMVVNQTLERSFSEAEAKYLQVVSTNAAIALKNILFTAELERSHWELIQALAQAIEAKDSYTSNHVGRVRDISVEIARAIGLDRETVKVIAISATLHDVGKISTPDAVLLKPGPLSDDEYEIMKQHAENGAQILRGIRSLPEGVEGMVRHHHERWDGKGYPEGKKGADIPLGAQIISIADCYDAMTYDRPYRKGFAPQEALKRMEMGCGTQFNPKLLCAFFAIQGYLPKTEPSAIATYQEIIGRLKMGGIGASERARNPNPQTGGLEQGREQGAKPLLLERN
jgi:putative nucleotidyltransferase with HDIG domain